MKKHGHPRFYKILGEMAQLHSDKNHDYAENDRPLGNFERVAELVDKYNLRTAPIDTKVLVAIFYMLKQFDCFMNAIGTGKEMKVEGLTERLRDIEVYSVLIEILLGESK